MTLEELKASGLYARFIKLLNANPHSAMCLLRAYNAKTLPDVIELFGKPDKVEVVKVAPEGKGKGFNAVCVTHECFSEQLKALGY